MEICIECWMFSNYLALIAWRDCCFRQLTNFPKLKPFVHHIDVKPLDHPHPPPAPLGPHHPPQPLAPLYEVTPAVIQPEPGIPSVPPLTTEPYFTIAPTLTAPNPTPLLVEVATQFIKVVFHGEVI